MLRIRLFRTGKRNQPFFRIVVTDRRNPPKAGRFKESLGWYNPLTKEKSLEKERIKYWISKGAQPSDSVHNLLVEQGILDQDKVPVHSRDRADKADRADRADKEIEEKDA